MKKISLESFLELDFDQLLTVNGGFSCSGSSSGGGSSGSDGGGSGGGNSSSSTTTDTSKSNGAGSNDTKTSSTKSNGTVSYGSSGSGGGGCSSTSTPPASTPSNPSATNKSSSQTYSIPSDVYHVYLGSDSKQIHYCDVSKTDGTKTFTTVDRKTNTVISTYVEKTASGKNSESTETPSVTYPTETACNQSLGYTAICEGTASSDKSGNGSSSTTNGSSTSVLSNSTQKLKGDAGALPEAKEVFFRTDTDNIAEIEIDYSQKRKVVSTGGGWQKTKNNSIAASMLMQDAKNEPQTDANGYVFVDTDMHGKDNWFSTDGCLMTGVAKIMTNILGEKYTMSDVNSHFDTNGDGLLDNDEITDGIMSVLEESGYDDLSVEVRRYGYDELSRELFDSLKNTNDTTYVLAQTTFTSKLDKTKRYTHWVVVDGFSSGEYGQLKFDTNGTSVNDQFKNYVYGDVPVDDKDNNYSITAIRTITVKNN